MTPNQIKKTNTRNQPLASSKSKTASKKKLSQQRRRAPLSKSVGAVVLNSRNQVLLVFQRKNRYWEFPKGKVESGERELDTLKREMYEETGIKRYKLHKNFRRSMNYFFRFEGKPIRRKVVYYLIKTADRVNISDEHTEYLWLSLDRAKEKIKHKSQLDLLEEVKGIVYGK